MTASVPMLVSDLIRDALITTGELGAAETPTANMAQFCLRRLNRMVDLWQTDGMLFYTVTNRTLTTVAGQAAYAQAALSGSGRPDGIAFVTVTVPGTTVDRPVRVISAEEYALLPLKTTPGIPRLCYVDEGVAYDFALYPTPMSAMLITFGCQGPLPNAFAIGDTVSLPPGYDALLVESLAVDLCPSLGRAVPPDLARAANRTMAQVRLSNGKERLLTSDAPSFGGSRRGTYDIRGDR